LRCCSTKDVAFGDDEVQSACYLRELLMVEEGQGAVESDPPAAEPQPRHDFSVVQGFQVVGAEDHGATEGGEQAWRDALRLELEARAARLHQAVDSAIVLSNDGIIRWLGDPVAKLSLGSNVLSPGVVILADESLPDTSRETIKTRIELWIAATTRRLFAPLFALEGIQEGSEIVRDLAQELVRSLGVLEREPIKAKIKTLGQEDRAELRKQGVRFGAYYIFVPALLKPAPRNLALQLWSLQAPGDASELLRTLGPVASSGRTSLPLDKEIYKDGYRVAGYRSCGERIVRVDVAERLAGMIRAAIAGEAPGVADGRPSPRAGKGFVVSGEMTSLTGCSGEPFASILRSMGFRSVEMKRSDFFGSQSVNEAAGQSESPKVGEDQEPAGDEQASPPMASEHEVPADSVVAAPATEPAPDEVLESAEAIPDDCESVLEGADVGAEGVDALAENVEAVHQGAEAVTQGVDVVPEGAESVAEASAATADEPTSLSDPSDRAPAGDINAQGSSSQASAAKSELEKGADTIIVWRPDNRRTSPPRGRENRQSRSERSGRVSAQEPTPAPAPAWRRDTAVPKRPNRPNSARPDEKRRQRPNDYDMARSIPTAPPQAKAKVDPNSPFAKLLELRSLLEEQANKRR
jgi:ATP-dependent RNA helicase SUPV3L1/SUV3